MEVNNGNRGYLNPHSVFFGVFITVASGLLLYVAAAEHEFRWTVEKAATAAAATIGFAFAWWRASVADAQARTARRRADTAEAGLNIDRFQKGVELLDKSSESTWLAGLQTLRDLAFADPSNHYKKVTEQICEFIEQRSVSNKLSYHPSAVTALRVLSEILTNVEARILSGVPRERWPILTKPIFCGATLEFISLPGLLIREADFRHAYFIKFDWQAVTVEASDMQDAMLHGGDFSDSLHLPGCNVGGIHFSIGDWGVGAERPSLTLTGCWWWADERPFFPGNAVQFNGSAIDPDDRKENAGPPYLGEPLPF